MAQLAFLNCWIRSVRFNRRKWVTNQARENYQLAIWQLEEAAGKASSLVIGVFSLLEVIRMYRIFDRRRWILLVIAFSCLATVSQMKAQWVANCM